MTYKVFVKYHSGTGGQMLTTVLLSLMKPVEINSTSISTIHAPHITDLKHNFYLVWPPFMHSRKNMNDLFTPDMNGNVKAEKLLELFKIEFLDTDLPSYIIPTHWFNVHKMAPYIENAKVIHIYANEEDYDQIQYNVAYKLLYRDAKALSSTNNIDKSLTLISYFLRNVESIKEKYSNKLKDINTINDIDLSDDDCIRLLNWIVKFGSITVILSKIPNLNPDTNLHVNFRDIHNGNIVNQLDELAAFIGIEHLSDERRNNAIELINKYVAGQKDIPWKLSIDDY